MTFEEILVDQRVIERRKLCAGWGVNDAPYITQPTIDGKVVKCPYYAVWSRMVYSASQNDTSVCEEWRSFMSFRAWMEQQDWQGKQLDKNLLVVDSDIFSPEYCVFISRTVATVRRSLEPKPGPYPLGVDSPLPGRYRAMIGDKHLGYFGAPEEAHAAWRIAKIESLCALALKQTDPRVRDVLVEIAGSV